MKVDNIVFFVVISIVILMLISCIVQIQTLILQNRKDFDDVLHKLNEMRDELNKLKNWYSPRVCHTFISYTLSPNKEHSKIMWFFECSLFFFSFWVDKALLFFNFIMLIAIMSKPNFCMPGKFFLQIAVIAFWTMVCIGDQIMWCLLCDLHFFNQHLSALCLFIIILLSQLLLLFLKLVLNIFY